MRITHSTLHAINFGPGQQYVVLGFSLDDDQQHVALSSSSGSRLSVKEELAPCYKVPDGHESHFVALLSANLMCLAIITRLIPGQTLLLHNPTTVIASVMAYHARQVEVHLIITTASTGHSTPSSWIYINSFSSQRQIQSLLPIHVDLMVDMTDSKQVGERGTMTSSLLRRSLPTSCLCQTLDGLISWQPSVLLACQAGKARCILNTAIEIATQQLANTPSNPEIALSVQELHMQEERKVHVFSVIDWTLDTSVTVQISPMDSNLTFAQENTYWFVGLSSSLGLSLCDWMIDHGARHIVISSRNPQIDPTWLRKASDRGVTVKVAANDITDETALQALYDNICAELPPLAGIVQGAMLLRDSPLRDMTCEAMNAALCPKVKGSLNLDRVLKDRPLDFFIFMSSLTSIIGNAGQCNYSAANSFMCSLARQRRKRGLFTATINLGLVIGIGMTTNLASMQTSVLTKRGFLPVSEPALHQIFAEGIAACRLDSPSGGEILTELPSIPRYSSSSQLVWASDPKFGSLIRSGDAVVTQTLNSENQVSIADRLLKIQSTLDLKKLITGKSSIFGYDWQEIPSAAIEKR
jgi:hybrid polyketide synthase/nonribosomal peptide synthetase ACE1